MATKLWEFTVFSECFLENIGGIAVHNQLQFERGDLLFVLLFFLLAGFVGAAYPEKRHSGDKSKPQSHYVSNPQNFYVIIRPSENKSENSQCNKYNIYKTGHKKPLILLLPNYA